ncbi:MAG: hypothetical protein E6I06_09540 [Chloroflexi bacterium]|nr:MAG: hypothetical protein E6I06_09540 [Chloroflexota bacterium]
MRCARLTTSQVHRRGWMWSWARRCRVATATSSRCSSSAVSDRVCPPQRPCTRFTIRAASRSRSILSGARRGEHAAAASTAWAGSPRSCPSMRSRWAAEVGGSDAHILDAVGRAFTEFPGKTPKALRTAIESGATVAGRSRYRAVGLMRYAAWGLNHERYVAVV